MEILKQDLKLLCELNDYDVKISDIRKKISLVPYLIEEKRKLLEDKKTETAAKKQNFVNLNSLRKEKEALFDLKEKAIVKYSTELNAIKSNNVYKVLLLEIEKEKADKSIVEDEILELLDKIDKESFAIKAADNELKELEQKIKNEISEAEVLSKKLEREISLIEEARQHSKLKVKKKILDHYERLREGREGQAVSIIDSESCGSCGMVLRPQLINMAQKSQELVFCDNCSRILIKI